MNTDGIVLLAKKTGITSFSALNSVKKALNTKKVGHTGTLDSFAQGLLVVCTGRLTRLAGNIVEFDKTYKAVIKFGEETDTLEYTGKIIRSAPLPSKEEVIKAINQFQGEIMQSPPAFSAIHIDGKRASELARQGKETEIPPRKVTVYNSQIEDFLLNDEDKVLYVMVTFKVSKGTYIRSLARDIGKACGSAAHLTGLFRTQVGTFSIEDSAGKNQLNSFNIQTAIEDSKQFLETSQNIKPQKFQITDEELQLQEEIRQTIKTLDKNTSVLCGFTNIDLISTEAKNLFLNGNPLKSRMFNVDLHSLSNNCIAAVFTQEQTFAGLIEKDASGKIHYRFVCN